MSKVGIITLNGNKNYGNRLQNYALQKNIENLGLNCETIIKPKYKLNNNKENKDIRKSFMELTLKEKNKLVLNKIRYELEKGKIRKRDSLVAKREERFKLFSKKYIKEVVIDDVFTKNDSIEVNKYDYFVTGSDQVWNPNYKGAGGIDFLEFAEKSKRIAYAPSFGVDFIEDSYRDDYKQWLNGINKISVREKEGAKIIKELTGREAKVVLDPTMLLTKEEWLEIATIPINKPAERYLLTYFLGDKSKEIKEEIKRISKSYKLKVINLNDIDNEDYYVSDPSEFISYINDASIFLTDSFHGCVFSLLLETPFLVFDREGQGNNKMNSRIVTFTETFNLETRRYKNRDLKDLFNSDFKNAKEILEVKREESKKYLKSALGIDA